MKKFIAAALIALTVAVFHDYRSDQHIFDRVVKLHGEVGSCTGEQVEAPSGEQYVLTAAHCKEIALKGGVIETQWGKKYPAIVIAEDDKSDLLLLMGVPGLSGLPIAKWDFDRQEIRTFTHGKGRKAYKTEGVLVQDEIVEIMMSEINSQEDLDACKSQPKNKVSIDFMGFICVFEAPATVSTAFVAPGSSGGPVVDSSGSLVGVVSASGGGFSIFVRLIDIQTFLANF